MPTMIHVRSFQSGFSLIELAVVLVIIGMLVGSVLGTLGARIENTRISETKDALDEIKLALYGFAISQTLVARLPCPDNNNDGIEDFDPLTPTQCASFEVAANLPWATLGIKRGDAWASSYSYWVADDYSSKGGFALATDATGDAQILGSVGSATPISNNVAAVIFSHGKNQYGSIGLDNVARGASPGGAEYADENENTNGDSVFVSRPITTTGPLTETTIPVIFDDIVVWISEYELKGLMVQAGVLP
jgi:prepilin-type N-terminal cleavage/methylation domain-containing protein